MTTMTDGPRRISIAGLAMSVLVAIASVALPTLLAETSQAACQIDTVGVDTSLATGLDGPILGEAFGQVFLASDSLISAITVWRIASEAWNDTGWHLFITATDSLGAPAPNSILLDGPTLVHSYGDGVHPIPFRFAFNPPFALPHAGKYYFAIQANPCDGFFNMEFNDYNVYPDGEFWRNGRTIYSGCYLRNYPEKFPQVDLVFTVEFCRPMPPALTSTWGAVKDRYRK